MAERRLSDEDVARLRRLGVDGWGNADLAEAFGVTPEHVARLLRGERRAVFPEPPEVEDVVSGAVASGGVRQAVDEFVADIVHRPGDAVLVATARVLAGKLDAVAATDVAAAAQAAPRLAAELSTILEGLRGRSASAGERAGRPQGTPSPANRRSAARVRSCRYVGQRSRGRDMTSTNRTPRGRTTTALRLCGDLPPLREENARASDWRTP